MAVKRSVEERFATIGETPGSHQSKKTFIFPVDKLPSIIPKEYYITTGEAIVKMDYLIKQTEKLLNELYNVREKLNKTKGKAKWLETCWEGGVLLVKKKDARGGCGKGDDKE